MDDTDKTRLIRKARPGQEQGGADAQDPDATRMINPGEHNTRPMSGAQSGSGIDSDPTRRLNNPSAPSSFPNLEDSDKTQLVRRSKPSPSGNADDASAQDDGSIEDPVTGWFVVIDGPGKGKQVAIGEQDNRVGRGGEGSSPRIVLDFGDAGVTRDNAFTVRYDPKKRLFKLLPGSGSNIVYLNDEDLDSPTSLKAGDVIELSDTKLRFVPFCGEGFDWADTES
ncbi:MAG: FHA domain-containing protein [Akkermansiaceae bacterium]